MKALHDYTVVVTPDDGTWLAYVPALDGCHAIGDTPEEARSELQNVFDMFSEIFEEQNREWPPDVRELVAIAG